MSFMTYDPNPVPVLFTDTELSEHVTGIVANMKVGDEISFKQICAQIIQMAEADGKLKPNTQYSSSELTRPDQERISAIMWELLLDRRVYTVFGSYRWFGRREDDTIFVIK